ncbi:unnamed protein product [Echinostoma caproni]|uniref:E3 ubiquitin-protein ligase CBL n=1 Tax=Echinostoma caproni TaxID=27848 RepID=A0A183AMP6_9TREM|nr:unnamed protein product [Echinostoma caproni]
MISGATRSGGGFSTWSQVATSLFRSGTSSASYSNPWSVDGDDHSVFDQQTIETCYKWLDRVVRLCQNPRLNLKNSPPYLLDTIPDVYEKLKSIISSYSDEYKTLSQLEYFCVFVHSVTDKCKRTVKLFKDSGEKIYDVHSHARFRLVKLSLIFSHLLKDLEALFPQNTFCPGFRITKPDAARWWSSNFGSSVIVPWPVFQTALLRTFRVDSADQLIALRNTIDLTYNKYVSIFEFDVFIRLFQPWSNILETWKALAVLHPGYMAFMTYDEVKAKLKQYRSHPGPGTYVFRLSCTKLGQWAIGYITDDLKILQTIIQNKSLAQALLDGEREGFYLYPNGKSSPSSLLYQLVHDLPQVRLQVTQEQYQVYCEMGSTFELCKICDENNKDVQLEPCGHLILPQTDSHQTIDASWRVDASDHVTSVVNETVLSSVQANSPLFDRSRDDTFRRLNYAQLDLNSSESDPEITTADTVVERTPTINTAQSKLDPSRSNNQQARFNLSIWSSEDAGQLTSDLVPTNCELVEDSLNQSLTAAPALVTRLTRQHADLDEATAGLLLSITRNDLTMACLIWKHFMPRTGSN